MYLANFPQIISPQWIISVLVSWKLAQPICNEVSSQPLASQEISLWRVQARLSHLSSTLGIYSTWFVYSSSTHSNVPETNMMRIWHCFWIHVGFAFMLISSASISFTQYVFFFWWMMLSMCAKVWFSLPLYCTLLPSRMHLVVLMAGLVSWDHVHEKSNLWKLYGNWTRELVVLSLYIPGIPKWDSDWGNSEITIDWQLGFVGWETDLRKTFLYLP